jgi:hypothetical protein
VARASRRAPHHRQPLLPTPDRLPSKPQADERLLRKLLGKVKSQADQDETEAAHTAAAEEAALRQIVGKYKLADVDVKALLEWKHAHYVSWM